MNGRGETEDLYRILGVSRDASAADIKKAYRQLVRKYHPDANPGNKEAEEHFKKINQAYEVLGDPQKKAQYDQFGTIGDMPGGSPFEGFGGMGDIFGDIFDNLFGGAGGMGGRRRADPNAPRRGSDLEMDAEVTLQEAASGAAKEFQIPRQETCGACGGSGAKAGTSPETCGTCGGRGQVEGRRQTPFGQFVTVNTCPSCGGRGKTIKEKCPSCGGTGRVTKTRRVEVKIPAGVDTGTRLRISGEGEGGINGGPPGDLYIHLTVADHPDFKRDGADLHTRLFITYPQAALGCTVEVPLLLGEKESLSIPAGTQPGRVFTLRKKGIPRLRGARGMGDLHVHVMVDVPRKLTDRQKSLLEELAKEMKVEVETEESGGFGKFFRNLFD
ncbi:MAG: molecular chaperone DnaJ [Aminivibrio sp.]|jgi:molecular chaperone DnaJ|nr:molecular chaperone DnaJ [Synergistaceae bacterium]